MPTMGGNARPFLPAAASIAWSPDRARIVFQPGKAGDPIFVADRNGGNPRQIFIDKPGVHNHYPAWSPDGRFVYFAHGLPSPSHMDIWRIPSTGGTAERLTNHDSHVAYPAFLDERTLLYTASRPDGSGSGLYAMDVDRRIPHAVSFGLEEYVSVAASADGRRLVVTVANPTSHLWTAPISEHVVDDSGVSRFSLPAVRAAAPRFGPDYILFLSSKGGADGLWKFKDGSDTELWKGAEGSVTAAPAISPDGDPDLLRGPGRETGSPPRDGGGWHGRSSRRRVARCPRCPVLVSGRKVDRRRRVRGERAAAVQDCRGRWSSGAAGGRGQLQPGLVARWAVHRVFRASRGTDVPAEGDHSGEAAIPRCRRSRSGPEAIAIGSYRTARRWR